MKYDFFIDSMTWSYSRLTAFEQCPYGWMLLYIYESDKEPRFFSEYGSFAHDLLARHFLGELSAGELLGEYISGFRKNVKAQAPTPKIRKNRYEEGKAYFRNPPLPGRTVLDVERKLEFQYAGHKFTGFLDLLSRDENGALCLTDHKSSDIKPRSGRKKPTKGDLDLDDRLRQLYIYSAPVKDLYGQYPDFLEFNCFRTGVLVREPFDIEKYKQTEQWATELIETIRNTTDWLPHEDYWYCQHLCDVTKECEYRD